VFVEVSEVGTELEQGGMFLNSSRGTTSSNGRSAESIGAVESVKAASDIVESMKENTLTEFPLTTVRYTVRTRLR
jgi:glycine cleavage system H lipoate-binding protein